MDKIVLLDPNLCHLRGHGYDPRKFLDYLFQKQTEMLGVQTEGALPVSEYLRTTVPKISKAVIERFSRVLKSNPAAYKTLLSEIYDIEKLPLYKSAEKFLENFLRKYPVD
jgi:hypothetical protein